MLELSDLRRIVLDLRRPLKKNYEPAPDLDEIDLDVLGDIQNHNANRNTRYTWAKVAQIGFLCCTGLTLASFGILHIVITILGRVGFFGNFSHLHSYTSAAGHYGAMKIDQGWHLENLTQHVNPIPCHSHNDYWRRSPFYDAIRAGCTSVEADIWLVSGETELLVGHDAASLDKDKTLNSLYMNPIVDLLDKTSQRKSLPNHGIFDRAPNQTLTLLLDFKSEGELLLPLVIEHMEPLRQRDQLSFWDDTQFVSRAVTVVITGNIPDEVLSGFSVHRNIFVDAPLGDLAELSHRLSENSSASPVSAGTSLQPLQDTAFYASTSLKKTIGFPWMGRFTSAQLEIMQHQINDAHQRGLRVRYWDTPAWPTSTRNYVWRVLLEKGVDVLNIDDLTAAAFWDWTDVMHDWFDGR